MRGKYIYPNVSAYVHKKLFPNNNWKLTQQAIGKGCIFFFAFCCCANCASLLCILRWLSNWRRCRYTHFTTNACVVVVATAEGS